MGQIKDTLFILGIIAISLITVAYAAPVAGQRGVATITGTTITACQSGFYGGAAFPITADSCQVCNAGSYTGAANTLTACVSCQAGYYCAAATYAAGATTGVAKASCQAGSYCASGVAAGTACPIGQYCALGVAAGTACASGTFITGTGNDAASDCQTFAGTAITGCAVYDNSTGTGAACNVAADGYFLTSPPTATVTPCLTNCGVCTGSTYATCTTPKAGFFKDATTTTVIACATGCKTCNAAAANSCTATLAGFYLDATAGVTACPAGKGAPDGNTGVLATCIDCNAAATGLCGNCKQQGFCTTCKAGNVLTASTGVCTAFDQTTKHVTCLLAEGTTNADCNTCDAAKFRTMEIDATTSAAKAKGMCKCMDGYAEEATVVAACKACGTNVATCTFNSAGVETIVTCKATFHKLTIAGVTACVAANLSGTDVTGFFWDTAVTPSQYVACNAGCKTCNGAGADKCVLCPARASAWVAPTESEANYATYLTLITNINNTCYGDCPSGWQASETRDSCVAASAGSASGIFGVLLLIASLFLLI